MFRKTQKNKKYFIIAYCVTILFVAFFLAQNTFADDVNDVVETTFFGNLKDDGKGCGVYTVLNMVLDIMTIGIGILGVIGVMIVGIQYLTAKDNEAQTQKAKRRITEIIIGITLYAILYAGLNFLLPGGKMNASRECEKVTTSDTSSNNKNSSSQSKPTNSSSKNTSTKNSSTQKQTKSDAELNLELRNKISDVGVALAWSSTNSPYKSRPNKAFSKAANALKITKGETNPCRKKAMACGIYVGTVVRYSGVDPKLPKSSKRIYKYVRAKGEYKNDGGNKKWKELKNKKDAKPGDIALKVINGVGKHVALYVKNKKGKTVTAEASLCNYYGVVRSKKKYINDSQYKIYRFVGT